MCGIAGTTVPNGKAVTARMLEALAHRGPDGSGIWSEPDGRVTLGCARLATTDPSPRANQPLSTLDGRFVLTFNGYIAGHRSRIADARAQGIECLSDSDAELVLQLLARSVTQGDGVEGVLASLSGQYALALWDQEQGCLWLVRDPLGIKPLYIQSHDNGDLSFASELPALAAFHPDTCDDAIKAAYLAHLFVPAPQTGVAGVKLLEPGGVIRWQKDQVTKSRVSVLATQERMPKQMPDQIADLRNAVRQSVADALDADCPVGCLVSGGLDSAGVSAMACEIARERGQPNPVGFVMGFDDRSRDETEAARALCDSLGQKLHVIPAPTSPQSIHDALCTALRHIGAPFANPSVVLHMTLSKAVGEIVRVCLAGDGGDELFGGYPRYQAAGIYDRYWRHMPQALRTLMAGIAGDRVSRGLSRFVQGGAGNEQSAFANWNNRCAIPELESRLVDPIAYQGAGPALVRRMMAFDRDVTLPGNQLLMSDRCGMAYGVEYRVPLLAHDIVRLAADIPATQHLKGRGKNIWRAAIRPYLPRRHLENRKVGFNPPVAEWLGPLGGYLWGDEHDVLAAIFDGTAVPSALQAHYWRVAISGQDIDMSLSIWALMVWRIWQDLDPMPAPDTSDMHATVDFA